jgi:VanZ family protein
MAAGVFIGAEAPIDVPIGRFDKLVHFLYYGLMAGLLAHGVGRRWLWVPLVLVPVVGAMDEWNQSMIVGRDASFWDWLADEVGTLVAVFGYSWVTKKRDEEA